MLHHHKTNISIVTRCGINLKISALNGIKRIKHSDLNVPRQILIEVNSVLLKKKIFPGSLRLTSIVCQHNYLFSFTVINIRNRKQFSNTNQSCYLLFSNRICNSIFSVVIAPLVSIGWCLSHGFPEQHVSYDKHRLLINNCC